MYVGGPPSSSRLPDGVCLAPPYDRETESLEEDGEEGPLRRQRLWPLSQPQGAPEPHSRWGGSRWGGAG